jgi:hypothetical protein
MTTFGAHNAHELTDGHAKDGTAVYNCDRAKELGLTMASLDIPRLSTATDITWRDFEAQINAATMVGIKKFLLCLDEHSIFDWRSDSGKFLQNLNGLIKKVGKYEPLIMAGRELNLRGINAQTYCAFQTFLGQAAIEIVAAPAGAMHTEESWRWTELIMAKPQGFDYASLNWLGTNIVHAQSLAPALKRLRKLTAKPIIMTELGYGGSEQAACLVIASQAAMLRGVETIIFSPWMRDGILPGFLDFGILNQDGSPKRASFSAVQKLIADNQ